MIKKLFDVKIYKHGFFVGDGVFVDEDGDFSLCSNIVNFDGHYTNNALGFNFIYCFGSMRDYRRLSPEEKIKKIEEFGYNDRYDFIFRKKQKTEFKEINL